MTQSEEPAGRRRIAVVGAGVAGLTAAYVLQRGGAEVTLFEAEERLGGHAHTHDVPDGDGPPLAVDSGFIVHNRRTYPLLTRLFDELGVRTRPCEMSMAVTCEGCGLEYAGARGLRGLFPTAGNLARPRYLRMLGEIPRFHRAARRLLRTPGTGAAEPTLGEFARRCGHSGYFTSHFLLPLVSAVWSCPPGTALDYPARYLFAFLANHGMLSVFGSPRWRTVVGGSRGYVERAAKELTSVRTATPVHSVRRTAEGLGVRTEDGAQEHFDAGVIATHADQALRLLERPSDAQRRVLGAFGYSRNPTLLHTDPSLLPRAAAARASWNHRLQSCSASAETVRVSYHMNRLQGLDARSDYVVSLNSADAVPEDRVLAAMVYHHPVYTPESLAAQRLLPDLNDSVLAFAGAHHGWGFHEDGCRSGVAAAEALGTRW
ncbi:putative NAD/FAD-binding protein [Spinactinospora alkalitolerans]|uniref:Putative NAD/FAD-binding protein n=1 Tax=Spinactinospora alkalitolerans TaxID=687207 RepID=A0A852TTI5_9ACTN|nr:FAD-dependent oxidoreductase [Spinactinospora alkalitolerans]NYE47329.1 putative NAD/FAD-binding protein [Spinactinospora alkalitolerans]